jgi:hypothetical protein
VNLFVVGWSPLGPPSVRAAERALRRLLERLPFLDGVEPHVWTSASGAACAVCASHPTSQTGGIRYSAFDREHLAIYSGRPVRWAADGTTEGRGPLTPDHYLHPPETWMRDLGGRCVAVRWVDGQRTLDVFTDPMGAYPVFACEAHGTSWISNNAEVLHTIAGRDEQRLEALAGMLGGGWSLSGHPRWAAVRRLERGRLHRLGPPGEVQLIDLLPLAEIVGYIGSGFNAKAAADALVRTVKGFADWPGRPSLVPVTGGRDSRLVLAAALHARLDFEAITGGEPQSPDVVIGRQLAETTGVHHSLIPDDPAGNVFTDWRRAARMLDLTSSGTACLADAAGFPLGPRPGPLALWHSGQGGEIARGYYAMSAGGGDLVELLYRAFVSRRPWREELLSEDGARLVRRELAHFVDEVSRAGAAHEDVPDLFYLLRRMTTWAGPSHGCVEFVRDTTSPLWNKRMLRHELGLPGPERAREEFHRRVLLELDRRLAEIPYESPGRAGRTRTLARKAYGELRRRRAARRPAPEAGGEDPFAGILPEIREVVLAQPDHPAWPLLDRARVERLLGSDPASLDTMSRYYAWRLATVFGAEA